MFMNKEEIHIIHLLEWVEANLDTKLSASIISIRSGYSKWHLQRMFKACTGLTMMEYVRSRRLCKAAMELKFSNRSISEIVDKYHFDSQSSFTRAFSTCYGSTPGRFRDSEGLSFGYFNFKFLPHLTETNVRGEYVYFDHLLLYGLKSQYICPVNEIKNPHRHYRKDIRNKFVIDNGFLGKQIYTLAHFSSYDENNVICDYHLGTPNDAVGFEPLPIVFGDFLKFDYDGHEDGIYDFVMSIYFIKFNTYYLTRRNDFDIEIFTYLEGGDIKYSYFIPIVFDPDAMVDFFTDNYLS